MNVLNLIQDSSSAIYNRNNIQILSLDTLQKGSSCYLGSIVYRVGCVKRAVWLKLRKYQGCSCKRRIPQKKQGTHLHCVHSLCHALWYKLITTHADTGEVHAESDRSMMWYMAGVSRDGLSSAVMAGDAAWNWLLMRWRRTQWLGNV